jgi:superoxide reductase
MEPKIGDFYQEADWKTEKHAPVIDGPDTVKKGDDTSFVFTIGKEIPHPNKTEHHICWIEVFFQPDGEKFPYQIGKTEFTAHGGSVQGPDTSTVYSQPVTALNFKTDKPGVLFATSYCNIHGLWQSSKKIGVN